MNKLNPPSFGALVNVFLVLYLLSGCTTLDTVTSNQSTTYVVQRGDTLAEIAQRLTGDSSNWRTIAAHNNISNPKKLRVGQALAIPSYGGQSQVKNDGFTAQLAGLFTSYDPNQDSCASYRQPLESSKNHFAQSIIGEGLKGAAIAAAGTAIIALVTDDQDLKRQIGRAAIAGALAGGAYGYIQAKEQQAKNKADMRRLIYKDARSDNKQLGQFGRSIRALNKCRSRQVAEVKKNFKARRIDKKTAKAQLKQIRAAIQDDNKLVNDVIGDVEKRNAIYVGSLAQVENLTEQKVKGKARNYKPRVVKKRKGSHRVSKKGRPKAKNTVQKNLIEAADTKAVYLAEVDDIKQDLNDMDLILQT